MKRFIVSASLWTLVCGAWAGETAPAFENYAVPSWGDIVWVYGPGTDPAMDTPQALEHMIQHWKGRGFTGVTLRTDLEQLDPKSIRRNPPVNRNARLAVIWNSIDEVSASFDLFSFAANTSVKEGFEFWAWHPHLYSDGAPETAGGPGPGHIWPWTYCARYTYDHPEVVTVDRKGNRYWMVREYAYPGSRDSKVAEFVYMAKRFNIKHFISCMRSESSQIQSPPDKADRFGFNPPVVEDMKRLYGVDIMTDRRFDVDDPKFDPSDSMVQKWHDLRGTYVTQFYRELRQGLNAVDPNIQIAVTLSGDYAGPPLGNWRLDWRRWVDEGLVDVIITPVTFEATLDLDSEKKGYLTDVKNGKGIVPYETMKDYIARSKHPEIKVIASGGMPYQFSPPPKGADGWRTDVWYSAYHLAWYQRWQQWKKDLKELGYISFLEQNFDSFPLDNNGYAGGWGDARYNPNLRTCPGCWTTLGDGTDARPIAQTAFKHGEKGRAMKLTSSADGRGSLTGWHNSFPDRSNLTDGLDNGITCGSATFECWLFRASEESGLSVYLQGDGDERDVGLSIAPASGKVSYAAGSSDDSSKAGGTWTALHAERQSAEDNAHHTKWMATGYAMPVGSWQKLTVKLDADKGTYSAFAGEGAAEDLCMNIKYAAPKERYVEQHGVDRPIKVPAYRIFKLVRFDPEGKPGNVSYVDDVAIRWIPTLHFAPVAQTVWLADDFESYPVRDEITSAVKAQRGRWRAAENHANGYYIDNNTSFGEGVKCLHARGGVELAGAGQDPLNAATASIITVDLDLFLRSDSSFPYMIPNPLTKSSNRTTLSLGDDAGSPPLASVRAGEGVWQIWSGNRYVDSGVRIAYDVWNHLQLALDCKAGTCKVVVQPVGEMPTPVGTGEIGKSATNSEGLSFKISPSNNQGHLSLYDNVMVAYQ
jgi:hypothetical protein